MHYIKATMAMAALAGLTNAVTLQNFAKRDTGLEVTLEQLDNSVVKATVKNVGSKALNLLTSGSIFDKAPVEKLAVTKDGSKVDFEGVLLRISTTNLTPDVFHLLEAGATYETIVDAASVHTLSTGKYSVVAAGAVPYAEAGSTVLSGQAVYYQSNTLDLDVDGAAANKVKKAVPALSERTVLQSGCSAAQKTATLNALANCAALARAASTAATSGSATKFSEYFKTTATATRSVVAARLAAIASQCSSSTSGAVKYYCTDSFGYCSSNVLAYTLPSSNLVVNCPIYYTVLPGLTKSCHAQDQSTTTLHEMSHNPAVYSPYCQDNGYGYAAATALTSAKAVLNADSYALYANAIYAGC